MNCFKRKATELLIKKKKKSSSDRELMESIARIYRLDVDHDREKESGIKTQVSSFG